MKRLTKSSNKIVGGVLSGFAEYIAVDPVWVRLGFVFFALIGFFWPALILYIIGAIIMPREDNISNYEGTVGAANSGYLIIGIGLIFIGVVFLINQIFHINLWYFFNGFYYNFRYYVGAIVLISVGILIIIKGRK